MFEWHGSSMKYSIQNSWWNNISYRFPVITSHQKKKNYRTFDSHTVVWFTFTTICKLKCSIIAIVFSSRSSRLASVLILLLYLFVVTYAADVINHICTPTNWLAESKEYLIFGDTALAHCSHVQSKVGPPDFNCLPGHLSSYIDPYFHFHPFLSFYVDYKFLSSTFQIFIAEMKKYGTSSQLVPHGNLQNVPTSTTFSQTLLKKKKGGLCFMATILFAFGRPFLC